MNVTFHTGLIAFHILSVVRVSSTKHTGALDDRQSIETKQ